jgi:hypothetical protein
LFSKPFYLISAMPSDLLSSLPSEFSILRRKNDWLRDWR